MGWQRWRPSLRVFDLKSGTFSLEKVQLFKPWFLRSGRGYESLNNGS